jgi:hypothetical protein
MAQRVARHSDINLTMSGYSHTLLADEGGWRSSLISKGPRKSESGADKAIRMWVDGFMKIEIAAELCPVPSYITRLLKLGAKRMGPL